MDEVEQALDRLVQEVRTAGDAGARALAAHTAVTAIGPGGRTRGELASARREAVNDLRAQGRSLAEIAALLGVTRGTVQQISEGRSTGRVVVPSRRNRRTSVG